MTPYVPTLIEGQTFQAPGTVLRTSRPRPRATGGRGR